MSDHSITIASKQSKHANSKYKAEEVLKWLISIDVVKGKVSDCCLGTDGGYAISNGAVEVTHYPEYLPFDLHVNGLSITTNRTVFDTGENGIEEIICPSCHKDISYEDWSFDDWYNEVSNNMRCPLCHTDMEINDFKFTPEWGFSNLGFTFWNWPLLKDDFLKELKQRIGTAIVVVHQNI